MTVTVLGRLGWANRYSKMEIRGRTATQSAVQFATPPAASPHIGEMTERSFPTTSVVDEVLSLLPSRPDFRACDSQAVHTAWEAIVAFARAPDGVAASYAKSILRWDAVPECVSSIQRSISAEFVVITATPRGEVLRWWVSGDSGWVAIAASGGEVSMVPSSPADIRYDLLVDLVAALTASAA